MKKSVLFALVLISILYLQVISADVGDACTSNSNCSSGEVCGTNSKCATATGDISTTSTDETAKINLAYDCLNKKIDEKKCSGLTLEQKIFSHLATGKCQAELMGDSSNNNCWPKTSCSIKETAQAILALSQRGSSPTTAANWLISQNTTPSDLVWYLQIETTHASTCDISYDSLSHQIRIDENKKISGSAGNCLAIAQDGYWLRITSTCYDEEFKVKCHESSFLINLLFKKETSSTIHVLERTQSGSAEEEKSEKVSSLCFSIGGSCDYEGSLWAVIALNDMNYNIDEFIPYLITMADDNGKFLPESFLWAITGYDDFKTTLLSKQKPDGYWKESDDKFYDTAVALFPITGEPMQKKNAKDWLLKVQDSDGCWMGNIRNTAFILASVWAPQNIGGGEDNVNYCPENRCIPSPDCQTAGGNILTDYVCGAGLKCCSVASAEKTCTELGGKICLSNKQCSESKIDSADAEGSCCLGTCNEIAVVNYTCVSEGKGECKTSCGSNEEEKSEYTCEYDDTCCLKKSGGTLWIWILIILIFLVIIGIIFRNKLRRFWFRLKIGKSKPSGPGSSGIFPMNPSRTIPQTRMVPRRIIPQQPNRPRPIPRAKPSGEFDDVLKRLKEMGK
ncbi:MAG: hypothetical protein WC584_04645 [Candidatus Pacearchaeota archaeon]